MIRCYECLGEKSEDDFYPHKHAKSLRMGICKDCHKARVKARARSNPAVQEYDRARAKRPAVAARIRATAAKWNEKHPAAHKAHTAVSNAVRYGRLKKQPCEFCGDEKVHAHHKDYSKPLSVIWLCPKCHHRLHAIFPELEGTGKALTNV